MRSPEGSRRIHALFRPMEGRNHPFRSTRDPGMTSTQPRGRAPSRATNARKRESTAMRILPRPIGALILVAIAAAAYGGYERLWHPHPSRGAEAPKPPAPPPVPGGESPQPACAAPHAPPPASRNCDSSPDGTAAGRAARAHDLSAAGRLRHLADQDLSRML